MQPNLFMWPGLLISILSSDIHIILDSVKASKNSRYNRNRIAGSGDQRWLTIPFTNFSRDLTLNELLLDTRPSVLDSLENLFYTRYSNAMSVNAALDMITCIKTASSPRLCDVYLAFLDSLTNAGFKLPKVRFASELRVCSASDNTLRGLSLVNGILSEVGATTYLAAQNVRSYSQASDYSVKKVFFQHFKPEVYDQYSLGRLDTSFLPCLSVLDIVASIGVEKTMSHISHNNSWSNA